MSDHAATFALCGNQLVDHLLAAQREDCRLPLLLVTKPDLLPEPVVRAALIAAVQRLED